jgi:UDPglucose 6-dehydrogenase
LESGIIPIYEPGLEEIVLENFQTKTLKFTIDIKKAFDNAEAMILLTEWKEFRSPDFDEIKKRLKNTVIFDGRNQYNKKRVENYGFEYFQIGVK